MSLLAQLADPRAQRSKAARKLADCVVAQPERVVSMSTAALAALAQVSEPTVNRFCTGLGFKGFPDFKLALAAELARQRPRIAENISAADSVGEAAGKVFEGALAALEDTHRQLDLAALHDAVDAMVAARAIVICGLGASASVAVDAQHKLLRFPTPVTAHTDMISQRMAAAGLQPDDCLLCISYSGRTRALNATAALARDAGAQVIGITEPDSPLAKLADTVLAVRWHEDTDLYTPMSSRIAQLALIDVLTTCVALHHGDALTPHLQRLKEAVAATRRQR